MVAVHNSLLMLQTLLAILLLIDREFYRYYHSVLAMALVTIPIILLWRVIRSPTTDATIITFYLATSMVLKWMVLARTKVLGWSRREQKQGAQEQMESDV